MALDPFRNRQYASKHSKKFSQKIFPRAAHSAMSCITGIEIDVVSTILHQWEPPTHPPGLHNPHCSSPNPFHQVKIGEGHTHTTAGIGIFIQSIVPGRTIQSRSLCSTRSLSTACQNGSSPVKSTAVSTCSGGTRKQTNPGLSLVQEC
jgi:hypothetical protein